MYLSETYEKKWQVLEHPIYQKLRIVISVVTSVILENQERSIREDRAFLSEASPKCNSTNATVIGYRQLGPDFNFVSKKSNA